MRRWSGTAARRRSIAVGLLLVGAAPAAAALPPVYQRAREIAAVVEAAAPKLDDPIDAVRAIDPATFEVRAGACRLEVRIVLLPVKVEPGQPAMAGPVAFEAVPGAPACN